MGKIVDGEEDFRTILSSIMEEEEFKALVAQNGDTALRMIRLDPSKASGPNPSEC